MKKTMQPMKLSLTDAQLRKLAKGQGVIIKPDCMESEKGYGMMMSGVKHRRMMKAKGKGKGYTLKFEPDEMDANELEIETGGRINWKKIGRQLRSTAKSVGRFYNREIKPTLGPALKKLVKKGIEKGIPAATTALSTLIGQPELGVAAAPYVEKFAEKIAEPATAKIGKTTGAYGMKKKKKAPKKAKKAMGPPKTAFTTSAPLAEQINKAEFPAIIPYRAQIQDNYSGFLNPNHPGMNPTLPMPDMSLPIVRTSGRGLYMSTRGRGLFMQGNGLYMRGGALNDGLPSDPKLPQRDMSYSVWGNMNSVQPLC